MSTTTKSIAVLPFVNMSTDLDNEYFSDGMTEEIINALTRIEGLKVTSRTSSFHFKGKNLPIPQIGKELGVSTILEGSVRLGGKQMRITAQLIDVEEDIHFWSETFDRSVEDVFSVQDEVSLLIADKLREHLGHFEIEEHLVDRPTVTIDIYKRYLRARYLLLKMTKTEIDQGLEMMKQVIAEAPDYPLAYLGVHLGYTLAGTIGYMRAVEAFSAAKPYLDKAIELNEDLPECQLNLSWIKVFQHWDFAGGYQHLQKVMQLHPIVDVYQSMASILVAEGRFIAALNYIETAVEIDPFSSINYHLKGFIYYVQEDYKNAIPLFEKSLSISPNFMASTLYLGQALLLQGPPEAGLDYFQSLPADETGDLMRLGGTSLAHASLSNLEETNLGIRQIKTFLETESMERALQFLIYCEVAQGKLDRALELVGQAVEYQLPMSVYFNVEPLLKPLRERPQFQALMRKIVGEGTNFKTDKRKYKKSLLDESLIAEYKRQLEQLMRQATPYLNPDLSLRSLAEMMEIPANQLSQLLNQGFDKNFAEYINSHRLTAFKSRAADPKNSHLTILALAYDSGFNSKTVFNTYFKKKMGMTPSAYWKQAKGKL